MFNALTPEIEGCNPFVGKIKQGKLLRKLYNPMIREAIVEMREECYRVELVFGPFVGPHPI